MNFFNNKFFLLGILGLIVVSIPLTLFFIKRQQQVSSNAEAASTLSFQPSNKADAHVGDDIPLTVSVDPGGKNAVSVVRLQIKYDQTKLQLVDIKPQAPFSTVIEPLTNSSGSASMSFGIGADITQAIQQPTTAAIVTFKALEPTDQPTTVSFETGTNTDTGSTQILSLATNDNPGENVLSTTSPATITILSGTGPVPTGDPTVAPTAQPTGVPTTAPTVVPTSIPTAAPTAVPTSIPPTAIPPTSVPPTARATLPPTGAGTTTTIGIIGGAVFILIGVLLFAL